MEQYREELIRLASVAVAAIQSYDSEEDMTTYDYDLHEDFDELGVDGYLEPETGKTYEVITKSGKMYIGYPMDWGFIPLDSKGEETIEEHGEEIKFFREIEPEG